ncbi:hypothetical protein GE09DRAFT_485145 [Coniochaeta sp. 2T2.1]|nr:hypothetical protein GE09DRAFT_485145 [Coniochaeta sp. 2T2.1]
MSPRRWRPKVTARNLRPYPALEDQGTLLTCVSAEFATHCNITPERHSRSQSGVMAFTRFRMRCLGSYCHPVRHFSFPNGLFAHEALLHASNFEANTSFHSMVFCTFLLYILGIGYPTAMKGKIEREERQQNTARERVCLELDTCEGSAT